MQQEGACERENIFRKISLLIKQKNIATVNLLRPGVGYA